jgi:hypothetical protein
MGSIDETTANATAITGYDIGQGKWWYLSNRNRQIKRLALCGSAVVGDTKVEVFYGSVKVAEIQNVALKTGASATVCGPALDTELRWMLTNLVCDAGDPIRAVVKVAPTTNAITLSMDVVEV